MVTPKQAGASIVYALLVVIVLVEFGPFLPDWLQVSLLVSVVLLFVIGPGRVALDFLTDDGF